MNCLLSSEPVTLISRDKTHALYNSR